MSSAMKPPPGRHSGLSMVEILVGLVVGLLIIAGASAMFLVNTAGSRQLQIESRLEQDLRTAMDLITRDLRRGAYWANAINSNLANNPYGAIDPQPDTGTGLARIFFSYSSDDDDTRSDAEQYGYRFSTGSDGSVGIDFSLGAHLGLNNWLPVSDSETMRLDPARSKIERLQRDDSTPGTPTYVDEAIALPSACPNGCATSCQVTVRAYRVTLVGISRVDPTVTRTLTSNVRVRNDLVAGSCNP